MVTFTQFLDEEIDKTQMEYFTPVVIAPGKYNPPHSGHHAMIRRLIKVGQELNAQPIVFIIDTGKYGATAPLTGEQRKAYLKKMFPDIEIRIAKTAYDAVTELAQDKKIPVGGVTGTDRAESYKKMIGRILGKDAEENYQAVVLKRDPDAEGSTESVSSTKVRNAVQHGDTSTFKALVGLDDDDDVKELMLAIRQGMGAE